MSWIIRDDDLIDNVPTDLQERTEGTMMATRSLAEDNPMYPGQGYIAWFAEDPGISARGESMREACENLLEKVRS